MKDVEQGDFYWETKEFMQTSAKAVICQNKENPNLNIKWTVAKRHEDLS